MDHVQKTARFLEQRLYQSSLSLQAYSDLTTLDSRIQILATVKVNRGLANKSKQRNRTQVLRKVLGIQQYRRAKLLVQAIRNEQQELVGTRMRCFGNTCTAGPSVSFHKSMPDPVRALYFESRVLLNAFEKLPVEGLRNVDWNTLLARGEAILSSYREWKGSEQAMML